jgi:hypothetical protein
MKWLDPNALLPWSIIIMIVGTVLWLLSEIFG